ncbi:AAA family ATPase [Desulfosarcina ovata]|uniref:Cytidylate kinase n=2 Tax=Desulfosarcina ovata TaxID=83564 RepID=A0A5K8AEI3_9BACT|nr:cytidylate kinase-like family protein [Desulfosarcina ovata]BBO84385.1 cytidylate kinase [Desulfosarcina ovata subsp. sediminis]BBO90898.1 cytidylate kinase [Desulfosarcina ovata subsp. ovata]
MAVITISRQFGAGGITLGKMVADSLGYTFADSDIIQRVAKEANVSTHWVESFEKEAGSKLSRLVSSMVSKRWIDRVLGDERGYLDEKIYLDYLVLIIAQFADEGNVVIIGRGSQYILNDHPDAIHVLLMDEFENRVKFMMKQYDMPEKKARRTVESEDRRRVSLYKRLGKTDFENPRLYHLVLNMGKMDMKTARDMICDAVKERMAANSA